MTNKALLKAARARVQAQAAAAQIPAPSRLLDDDGAPAPELLEFRQNTGASLDFIFREALADIDYDSARGAECTENLEASTSAVRTKLPSVGFAEAKGLLLVQQSIRLEELAPNCVPSLSAHVADHSKLRLPLGGVGGQPIVVQFICSRGVSPIYSLDT